MEEQLNREAKKGWRFAAHAARITMKEKAVKIESIRQEESSRLSIATWEQLHERKKVRLFRSRVTKDESPKHG